MEFIITGLEIEKLKRLSKKGNIIIRCMHTPIGDIKMVQLEKDIIEGKSMWQDITDYDSF